MVMKRRFKPGLEERMVFGSNSGMSPEVSVVGGFRASEASSIGFTRVEDATTLASILSFHRNMPSYYKSRNKCSIAVLAQW